MPREPPAVLMTEGRVPGAAAPGGGGSATLWIAECFCGTEPVTSLVADLVRNGLDVKRWVSELQLTAATEMVARTATRNTRSERPGSTTQRIGFPTHTRQN